MGWWTRGKIIEMINIGNFRTFLDHFRTIKCPKLAYQAPCQDQITPVSYYFLTLRQFHVFSPKKSFFHKKKFEFAEFRCYFDRKNLLDLGYFWWFLTFCNDQIEWWYLGCYIMLLKLGLVKICFTHHNFRRSYFKT